MPILYARSLTPTVLSTRLNKPDTVYIMKNTEEIFVIDGQTDVVVLDTGEIFDWESQLNAHMAKSYTKYSDEKMQFAAEFVSPTVV